MATAPHAKAVILAVATAVVDTVNEADPTIGAPAGPLYMAMQAGCGITLETFEKLMSALVAAGKLTKRGHCYFAVK